MSVFSPRITEKTVFGMVPAKALSVVKNKHMYVTWHYLSPLTFGSIALHLSMICCRCGLIWISEMLGTIHIERS